MNLKQALKFGLLAGAISELVFWTGSYFGALAERERQEQLNVEDPTYVKVKKHQLAGIQRLLTHQEDYSAPVEGAIEWLQDIIEGKV